MKVEIGPYPSGKAKRVERVRVHRYDLINADHTLALVILPILRMFRKHNNGLPGSMIDLSYVDTMEPGTKEFKAAEERSHKAGAKAWDAALDEMIWAFGEVASEGAGEPALPATRTKNAMAAWHRKVDAYNKRIEDGIVLFGKHLRSMWL